MAFVLGRRAGDGTAAAAPVARNPRELLAAADAARDARRWPDAAPLYRDYLEARPDDPPIWVQLGHALKESGDLAGAESAYKKSLDLSPETADTHLQLGHLYKRMRRFSDAIAAYREAASLDDSLVDARSELLNLGVAARTSFSAHAAAKGREPATFLDLSDVFFYLRHHKTVSGIQRVQLGIANAIVAMPPAERAGILFLTDTEDRRGFVVIDDVFLSELGAELARGTVEHARLIDIIRSATSLGHLYEPMEGDSILMLGAFWVSQNIAERVIDLGRRGVRVGTLIHDIIPITHPEFCVKDLVESFRESFDAVLSVASFVVAVSEHTARSLSEFIARHRLPEVPVRTLKSAHRTWEAPRAVGLLSPAVSALTRDDYVLYVSTIEVRKNHGYLFRIWKRLIDEMGEETPKLVFVGRPGWRVSDLMDQLDATNNLNGKIRILHDLSDAELAALYRSALFTVFPSFEEGWGLPVGESLVFGRPCVASSSSSVPEVAGDFVDYVDPFNDNDGYQKIQRLIADRGYREDRARYIEEGFTPREWPDVAADLVKIIRSLAEEWDGAPKTVEPPRAVPGRLYRLGHRDDTSAFVASGDAAFVRLACDTAWDRVENFGRWLHGPEGAVAFRTATDDNRPVLVMLEAYTVSWLDATQLRISVNGASLPVVRLERGQHRLLQLEVMPEHGRVDIAFEAVGEIVASPDDPRPYLWFGLGAIGYAPPDDPLARMALLESLVCQRI